MVLHEDFRSPCHGLDSCGQPHASGWSFRKILVVVVMALILTGLSEDESEVYKKLRIVAKKREETGQRPRPIVVITDVGKDYDDLAALVVLKEFHRLRLVELRAVVANLVPADKRAYLAKAALKSLGLPGVPVACGSRGSPDEHEVLDHEFNEAEFGKSDFKALGDGKDLLLEVYRNAKDKGEKLYLLCLSSLQDIQEFASAYPDLVTENTAEVHMQGGNYISSENQLEPDSKAANNRYNLDAAKKFHSIIQRKGITSHTYTKTAAFEAPLTSEVFEQLEATGHPIGAYLRRVQVKQDVAFYKQACERNPEKRFAPFMDQDWFLSNKTSWQANVGGEARPTGEEIIPYLTKIVLYDVLAALGIAGDDVVSELKVFRSNDRRLMGQSKSEGDVVETHHWILGDEPSAAFPDAISLTVSALLKHSLLNAQKSSN